MNKKYYYCYSYPLKKFLLVNGERYILRSVNNKTKKRYWVFEKNEKLNKLLSDWSIK